jgi:hypothetical protein
MMANKSFFIHITALVKVLQNMRYFIAFLLVVVMGYGVCRQAILHLAEGQSSSEFHQIILQPYLMMFGEIFADTLNSTCVERPDLVLCETAVSINYILMAIFLLGVNYGLTNLFTAMCNNLFNEVRANSHQVWMSHSFTVVQEYQQTPVLPAPLIVLCHVFLFLKFCHHKMQCTREFHDNPLKRSLAHEDLERLRDFEKERMKGYFRKQET